MKVLSIDVGIKNLAYCLIDSNIENNSFNIIKWDILNLCDNNNENYKCDIKSIIKKNKIEKICNRKASHLCNSSNIHNANYLCSTHFKKLYPNSISIKKIKKEKINNLLDIANKYNISLSPSNTKKQIIQLIINYIENNLFHEITSKSANNIDLITIGISIKKLFDSNLPIHDIDKIIIENQISPIANRMKSIQAMISQYFIMNNKTNIYFISSVNKLKFFLQGKKTEYKERKKISIEITKKLLNNNNISNFINNKKKDDLADSFLQCLWFLIHNKYLTIDLNII